MLALSLDEGEFISIGETIVRLTGWRHNHIRLAIDAGQQDRILRFNTSGDLVTGPSRLVRQETRGDAEYLVLSCGHEILKTDATWIDGRVRCRDCRDLAARISERIKAGKL